VHIDHGIGMFVGLKQIGIGDSVQEFLEIRYAGEDKLFVPVERLDLVQKYTGANRPPIDRLGGTSWERAKSTVKKATGAPTTVLAFQHQKTLKERFAGFPVRIEMVSRFRTKAEQKEVITDLAAGKVDLIVGTHRLLSSDVQFRDVGLLVVDEEQRFGVAHKEKIKQLKKKVDVLTMSATPIPRTLNMSLVGIRDMSIIETPPKDRLSIQTNVVKFDPQVIGRAIRNEMARGGQVYVVHNRVESIFSIGDLVQRLVPEARVVVGHG